MLTPAPPLPHTPPSPQVERGTWERVRVSLRTTVLQPLSLVQPASSIKVALIYHTVPIFYPPDFSLSSNGMWKAKNTWAFELQNCEFKNQNEVPFCPRACVHSHTGIETHQKERRYECLKSLPPLAVWFSLFSHFLYFLIFLSLTSNTFCIPIRAVEFDDVN